MVELKIVSISSDARSKVCSTTMWCQRKSNKFPRKKCTDCVQYPVPPGIKQAHVRDVLTTLDGRRGVHLFMQASSTGADVYRIKPACGSYQTQRSLKKDAKDPFPLPSRPSCHPFVDKCIAQLKKIEKQPNCHRERSKIFRLRNRTHTARQSVVCRRSKAMLTLLAIIFKIVRRIKRCSGPPAIDWHCCRNPRSSRLGAEAPPHVWVPAQCSRGSLTEAQTKAGRSHGKGIRDDRTEEYGVASVRILCTLEFAFSRNYLQAGTQNDVSLPRVVSIPSESARKLVAWRRKLSIRVFVAAAPTESYLKRSPRAGYIYNGRPLLPLVKNAFYGMIRQLP